MIVVCDASPIIALAAVSRLELLRDMYVDVFMPRAVHAEIFVGPGGPEIIAGAPWLVTRDAHDAAVVAELQVQVDPGEAEAIALAIELAADLLLIDDRKGRLVAVSRNLPVVGVVGILLEARERGLIARLRPTLDDLRRLAAFRLSDRVYRLALEAAHEPFDDA